MYLLHRAQIDVEVCMHIVTDRMEGMCVDLGEMGTTLQAGGVGGLGPPEGEKGGQLASDNGGG
jgi:hypothetical protein